MEDSQHFDFTDLLCALALFASFVVFGVCLWLLKREMNKKKAAKQNHVAK